MLINIYTIQVVSVNILLYSLMLLKYIQLKIYIYWYLDNIIISITLIFLKFSSAIVTLANMC